MCTHSTKLIKMHATTNKQHKKSQKTISGKRIYGICTSLAVKYSRSEKTVEVCNEMIMQLESRTRITTVNG